MDYLGRQRYIPRAGQHQKKNRQAEIDQRLCQSCRNYEFYYCSALEKETAPLKECMAPEHYISRLGNHVDHRVDSHVAMEE